jgi:hypothetical protein
MLHRAAFILYSSNQLESDLCLYAQSPTQYKHLNNLIEQGQSGLLWGPPRAHDDDVSSFLRQILNWDTNESLDAWNTKYTHIQVDIFSDRKSDFFHIENTRFTCFDHVNDQIEELIDAWVSDPAGSNLLLVCLTNKSLYMLDTICSHFTDSRDIWTGFILSDPDFLSSFYSKEMKEQRTHKVLPRQSYQMNGNVDHCCPMIIASYKFGNVRRDSVKFLELEHIWKYGSLSSSSVTHFFDDLAFKLGFACKYGA